jgi:hypothetical protein
MLPELTRALDALSNVNAALAPNKSPSLNCTCVLAPAASMLPEILANILLAKILPVPETIPDPNRMLPPVMLAAEVMFDVAEIWPPVNKLPPVTLAVAETTPPVRMLPPVMLAVAEIRPGVSRFPPVMLPVTLSELLSMLPVKLRLPICKLA